VEKEKPKRMEVDFSSLPQELVGKKNWVLWKWENRNGKYTKPPYQTNGMPAKSNDPNTWAGFDEVYLAYKNGQWDGVGFQLGEDLAGIDWDNCRDFQSGEIKPEILEKIKTINSYTEISPSGTGCKTLLLGKLPAGGHHSNDIGVFNHTRYFCLTGAILSSVSTKIEYRQTELDRLIRERWPDDFKPKEIAAQNTERNDLTEAEIIERALKSKDEKFKRLWAGDWTEYASQSEADQALCNKLAFWSCKNPALVDALFRKSGLYRDKWNREDYRARTINKAINETEEVYRSKITDYHCTDTGNGERFAAQHRGDAHFCHPLNKWYIWSGKHWKSDNQGAVNQLAKETARSIYAEASKEIDKIKRDQLADWAVKTESFFRQNAMLKMAQSEPGIPILQENLDCDDWLLNVNNGTLDLKTGTLLPHNKNDHITKLIPINYNPDAFCNRWLDFLNLLLNGNQQLIDYLCRVAGYTLTGDIGEQCLFLLWGIGQNGKSTFLNVLQSILGDYAIQTDFNTFNVKRNEGIRNDIARMKTSRLVVAIETGDNKRLDEPLVKQLTGGDRVAVRFLHQEYFEFKPRFKIFLAANYKPQIYGQDLAIWRRIRLIPFTVTIPESDRIANYENHLLEEKEGILNWMVHGCKEWQKQGLNEPDEVSFATESYRTEMDILNDFITDRCSTKNDFKTSHKELYTAYTSWCEENSEAPIKTRTFAKRLEAKGFFYTKPGNLKTWHGIGLE